MIKDRLVHGLVILSLAINPIYVRAGSVGGTGGATELTQISNNVELALQSIENQFQTIQQIETKFLTKLENLKESVSKYTAPFERAFDTYNKIKDTQRKLVIFKNKLEDTKTALDNRMKNFSVSNLDWGSYTKREKKLIQEGNKMAVAKIEANREVLEQTQTAMKAYQESAAALEQSTGTHQATRILGAQLTMIGGDLNKLISITAQSNFITGVQMADKNDEKEQLQNFRVNYKARQNAANEKAQKGYERLINYKEPTSTGDRN